MESIRPPSSNGRLSHTFSYPWSSFLPPFSSSPSKCTAMIGATAVKLKERVSHVKNALTGLPCALAFVCIRFTLMGLKNNDKNMMYHLKLTYSGANISP